eukprot:4082524-Alexandrium_andersonii.AAC.1
MLHRARPRPRGRTPPRLRNAVGFQPRTLSGRSRRLGLRTRWRLEATVRRGRPCLACCEATARAWPGRVRLDRLRMR